jgi:polysaccharide pyruvyl transferase WcaK-like protein
MSYTTNFKKFVKEQAWDVEYLKERLRPRVLSYVSAIRGIIELDTAGSNTIIYCGVIDEANLGDQILTAQSQVHFSEYKLIQVSNCNALYRLLISQAMEKSCGLIIGGGTLLLGSKSFLELLEECIKRRIPILTYGTGVQDPQFWNLEQKLKKRWADVLMSVQPLGVRGPKSLEIIRELGVSHGEVVGDPAVTFVTDKPKIPNKGKIIGINIGVFHDIGSTSFTQFFRQMTDLCQSLRHEGWQFKFFCLHPRDLQIIRCLIAASGIESAEIIEEYYSATRFIMEVSECQLMVSMRLHALILSICAGIPTIGIEYQPKLRDFMASINSEDMLLKINPKLSSNCLKIILNFDRAYKINGYNQWQECSKLACQFSAYCSRLVENMRAWRQ